MAVWGAGALAGGRRERHLAGVRGEEAAVKSGGKVVVLCVFLALLLLIGGIISRELRNQRLAEREEKAQQRKVELVQEAETLLRDHKALFDRVAAVLIRQEGPLTIDREPGTDTFLVNTREGVVSPDDLEDGFSRTVAELYDLVPSGICCGYADSPLIYVTYANENLGVEFALFYVVTIGYDGTAWSVQTDEFGGV